LSSRSEITDHNALDLLNAGGYSYLDEDYRQIFHDFLDSNHPMALDAWRYAVAALACLKILFGCSQAPVSHSMWFSEHSHAARVCMDDHYQWHRTDLQGETYQSRVAFYWHLRTHLRDQMPPKQFFMERFSQFDRESEHQYYRSNHLLFLLPKSAYSHNILNFARYRVFRFGYLHQKHPRYMKRAICALAEYIQWLTGETAEVRACESIWGHKTWFNAQ